MLEIYIARHGQNEDNLKGILNGHRDFPLTKKGIEQAQQLAQYINTAGIHFDYVFTSPLLRAHVTAKIITEALQLKDPVILDSLIERDFGLMTGKLISDIELITDPEVILKTNTVTYVLTPKGGETFPILLERAQSVLDLLHIIPIQGKILLVCHGDIGKMIYAAFYDIAWEEVLREFHFGNSELILLKEGSDPLERHVLKLEQYNH